MEVLVLTVLYLVVSHRVLFWAHFFFIILMVYINRGISSSSIVSFAHDTRLYHGVSSVDDCTILQNDLNSVYDWASCNNMSFNAPNSNTYIYIYIYILVPILHYLVTYTQILVLI